MTKVIALPMCSAKAPQANIEYLKNQLAKLVIEEPTLVCLPETWLAFCDNAQQTWEYAQYNEALLGELSALCQQHNIWLAAGTIAIPSQNDKYLAASYLFNASGEIVAHYNKIHLFDADVSDKTKQYRESERTERGQDVVVVDSPFGRIGLSVCYDLRFPGLFQMMRAKGAELFLVPSAFTCATGKAHWQPLLQARAIENQCYVVAAAQVGCHENGRETYGHSLIVSPWGEVLIDSDESLEPISQQLDSAFLDSIRQKMPIVDHNRFKSEFL
ncbi:MULTISPECIES: carbon-nitrogen hydrolase family protein [Pseudoalteromonas]|uniref:carbon-nitrogen hydrolase family protein n=1 Tax=Pseudoalteromonas TaxID=53246 RepID=UPI00057DE049|nr:MULTISPECIES: carbon-nitrogen hydrolase family protein [Pseudoalteromonas]KID37711.1 amidohydrolase [Pseudoalteromonas flavipulchra NCIMB 2033 = ATCC BAA-314]MBD0783909.1 carbon-nitrogen hydrolase family protein [Pseudoalteromonas flavipulchra]MBE0374490.1 nitrilase [Pseudoalteromonas flavipulchra NCIMB 2033 = ATCC BAA-314]RZG13834.1 carbon-nitrogen hydrolase family protein [Pseudoalteromonas sp. CO342X]